ncbi:Gfo/Idh/MocA family protein [Nitrosopumilus adriaticus]|uniref:Gfo/Idh/MocA family protein n=1 Tax=Nitrosopumilus adriaticus TaxID=1580092 RepID=UPI00352C1244
MKGLVVGLGSIGTRHVNNLMKYSDVDIIICSKRTDIEKNIVEKCTILDSIKQCLEEKPDFAILSNVTSLHVLTAIELAKNGIDLFIEKPLSNSLENIDELYSLVKKKNLITFLGCNMRFHKCIQKIKEILDNNEIGRVLSVRAESSSFLPDWHPNEDYRDSYAAKKVLGGGVVLSCIHEIDYLYWFFGSVRELFAKNKKQSDLDIDVEDLSNSLIHFKNNIIAELHLDFFQRPDFRSCNIIATKGVINWNSDSNIVKFFDSEKKSWLIKFEDTAYDRNDMYVDELDHFLNCIKLRKNTINDLSQGIETTKIALAILKSSQNNKVISFD